uniref:Uncharacterized protein n=1 Tax=Ralstonia solanacearum TaxID=305 RepID=A0A0S4TPF0_RALSL|nr:protein of unknown function [Ralstonia solanacearum]
MPSLRCPRGYTQGYAQALPLTAAQIFPKAVLS